MSKPVNISTFAAVKTFCLTLKTLKGMKKLMYLALAFIAIATGFTACQQQKNVSLQIKNDGVSFDSVAPFFYKAVFKDYNFNECRDSINKYVKDGKAAFMFGGCSEVRYGNAVGRNLDWYVNNQASAVIWVKREESVDNDLISKILSNKTTRYGSIAMVGANPLFTTDILHKNSFSDVLKLLPFATTDGINENGVYIGVNVAPAGETSKNPDNWKSDVWGFGAAYTQKEKLKEQKKDTTENAMCVTYLTRIILDHATSVDDAISIIDSLNWFEPVVRDKCYAFHWLICDSSKSAVVEFIDNKMEYKVANTPTTLNLGSVMTNFSNCIYDPLHQTMVQHGGSGYERYNAIIDYYKNLKNKDSFDIQELMQSLHFSKFYHEYYNEVKNVDKSSLANYRFKSEFAMPYKGLPAESLYPFLSSQVTKTFCDSLKSICEGWPSNMPACEIRQDTTKHYWYSTHTSIYNLKNQSFKVLIHEGYDESEKNPDGGKITIYREFALGKPGIVDPYKVKTNDK